MFDWYLEFTRVYLLGPLYSISHSVANRMSIIDGSIANLPDIFSQTVFGAHNGQTDYIGRDEDNIEHWCLCRFCERALPEDSGVVIQSMAVEEYSIRL